MSANNFLEQMQARIAVLDGELEGVEGKLEERRQLRAAVAAMGGSAPSHAGRPAGRPAATASVLAQLAQLGRPFKADDVRRIRGCGDGASRSWIDDALHRQGGLVRRVGPGFYEVVTS